MDGFRLYERIEESEVERARVLDLDPQCQRCPLHQGCRSVCLPADGQPGGLLVVGGHATKADISAGRPLTGMGGAMVRKFVDKYWSGPVVYDLAVRCAASRYQDALTAVPACRGYLAGVLEEAQPQRVLLLGSVAFASVLGRTPDAYTVRRGYSWLPSVPAPAFLLDRPDEALRNRFHRQMLEEDIAWAVTCPAPPLPPWGAVGRLVCTEADALVAEAGLRAAGGFAYDYETFGQMFEADFRPLVLAMCPYGSDDPWVWTEQALADPRCKRVLRRLFADPAVRKAAHNAKFDGQVAYLTLGVEVRGLEADTMLQRKLLTADAFGALDLCTELVGMGGHKGEATAQVDAAAKRIRAAQRSGQVDVFSGAPPPTRASAKAYAYAEVTPSVLCRYNARDAVSTRRLRDVLGARLAREPMARVWEEIVCPAVEALIRVERVGAGCDIAAVDACGLYFQTRMREVSARLHAAGLTNPSSPDAVGRFLFATLGLAPPMKTKKGADSTAKKALVALSGKHPAVGDLLLWRKLSTLNNTYAVGLRKQIASDGRIHTSYVLDGTETGRMSSRQPNLQNIPRSDTPEGKMVKNCFVARPGHTLVQFDYSQLELRIAAMLSQDPDMLAIFNTPDPVTGLFADYHMATARIITPIIWHDDWDRLSPDEQKKRRTLAKPVNFGLLYGRGDRALAEEMHSTVAMAAKVRAAVLGHFRVLAKWIEGQVTLARKTGEIWTWWGGGPARRRPLLDVASPDDEARGTAERSSYNTPCQGTGSDFCLSSLVAVDRWLAEDGLPADVVLTVHDSLVLDVRDDAVAEVVPEVIAIMEGWNSGGVRLRVDCEVGRAWGSLKPYVAGTV